jgi:transcriptional regulator with XRE-family HTH domain
MDLKKRIAEYIQQILILYGFKQRELADAMGISLGRLSAYIKGKELPRLDVVIRLAEIGGLTIDDLLKTDKPPVAKKMFISGKGEGADSAKREVHGYAYQPGDIAEEQLPEIEALVNEIFELENRFKKHGLKGKTKAAIYSSIAKQFGVSHYRKIGQVNVNKLKAELQKWSGGLKRSSAFPPSRPPSERTVQLILAIRKIAKEKLGWTESGIDDFVCGKYESAAMKNLGEQDLEDLLTTIEKL